MKLSERAKRTGNDAPLENFPLSISNQWRLAEWVVLGQAGAIYGKWDADLSLINPSEASVASSINLPYETVGNGTLEAKFSGPQVSNLNDWLDPYVTPSERVNFLNVGADFVF